MARGSFSRFDNAQWKLAENAVWANTWEQEATHGCPKGQRSRFVGGPVACMSLRRRHRVATAGVCAARRLEIAPLVRAVQSIAQAGSDFTSCSRSPLGGTPPKKLGSWQNPLERHARRW